MALSKSIPLDNGATATYFNVDSIVFDKDSGCSAVFNWYGSQAIRLANPAATLGTCQLDFPGLLDSSVASIYGAAVVHPSGIFAGATDC